MKKEKVRLINGEELAYIKHGTGKKNLIALHGRYYTSLYFETLMKELENEFTIYAVDLRGFGDSSYYREVKNTGNFAKDLIVTGSSSSPILFTIPKSYDFSNYNFVAVNKGDNPTQTTDSLSGTALNDVTWQVLRDCYELHCVWYK